MDNTKKQFIFFDSWERYLKALEDDRDINYVNAVARAIIQYGLYKQCDTDDATILRKVDAVCSDLMESTYSRYIATINNGKQGGRPTQYDPEVIQALRNTEEAHQPVPNDVEKFNLEINFPE